MNLSLEQRRAMDSGLRRSAIDAREARGASSATPQLSFLPLRSPLDLRASPCPTPPPPPPPPIPRPTRPTRRSRSRARGTRSTARAASPRSRARRSSSTRPGPLFAAPPGVLRARLTRACALAQGRARVLLPRRARSARRGGEVGAGDARGMARCALGAAEPCVPPLLSPTFCVMLTGAYTSDGAHGGFRPSTYMTPARAVRLRRAQSAQLRR
jgi:hypothetical protein